MGASEQQHSSMIARVEAVIYAQIARATENLQ
jgi:hypothetical protein